MVAQKSFRGDLVAVLRTLLFDAGETGAELHTLHRIDAHQGMGDVGIETVVDGLAKPGRHAGGNHVYARANGVALLAQGIHVGLQLGHPCRVRTEEGILIHRIPVLQLHANWPELGQVAADLDAEPFLEVLLGDPPGGHPHGRLPRRGTPAAAVVAEAVFLLVGIVGMRRPELCGDLGIVLGTLVGVVDDQADRGARGAALEGPGQDLHLVGLAALGGMARGAGLAPVQVALQVLGGQFQARRTAVHDAAQGRPVTLTEAGDRKEFSECVSRHGGYCSGSRRFRRAPRAGRRPSR